MAVLGATNLTGCNSIPDFIAGGSLMLFQQTAAPTSWTKQTTHNNKALRVVSGTATPGGSTAFTTVFASRTPAGTISASSGQIAAGGVVDNTTLATPQIPSHAHNQGQLSGGTFPGDIFAPLTSGAGDNPFRATSTVNTGAAGGGGAHAHPFSGSQHNHPVSATFSGTALDFDVQYVDIIICSKN
jgi:hypothetical protein